MTICIYIYTCIIFHNYLSYVSIMFLIIIDIVHTQVVPLRNDFEKTILNDSRCWSLRYLLSWSGIVRNKNLQNVPGDAGTCPFLFKGCKVLESLSLIQLKPVSDPVMLPNDGKSMDITLISGKSKVFEIVFQTDLYICVVLSDEKMGKDEGTTSFHAGWGWELTRYPSLLLAYKRLIWLVQVLCKHVL